MRKSGARGAASAVPSHCRQTPSSFGGSGNFNARHRSGSGVDMGAEFRRQPQPAPGRVGVSRLCLDVSDQACSRPDL